MTAVLDSVADVECFVGQTSPRTRASSVSRKRDGVELYIEEIQSGNEDAARRLMDHLYPLVAKLVRNYLPRRTSEEDLVQTVFMKIFTHLHQYSGAVPLEHWVSRITINTCINELKAEKIRPEWRFSDLSEEHLYVVETLAAVETDRPGPSPSEANALLKTLLEGLKPKERLIIQLFHLEEKSVKEIAQMTGWSRALIKVCACRARKKLQHRLQALEAAAHDPD